MYSRPIQKLLDAFARLPGVGPRTAERFVFHLLKSGKKEVAELAEALQRMIATVRSCETCFDFSDASPCVICRDPGRDAAMLCIVAEPADAHTIERSRAYRGRFFVLRGTVDPTDEEGAARLKLHECAERAARDTRLVEIILGFNPDVAGETTMLYLERRIRDARPDIRISRLARGIPMGGDLRYADDMTLGSALAHRTPMT